MRKMNKNNKGFTLVELIIVIAIIAILLALITPNLTTFLKTAEDTSVKANAKTAYSSAFAWATSKKADGVTIPPDASDTITKLEGGALQVSPTDTFKDNLAGLDTFFIKEELTTSTAIKITFGANNSVTKVAYTEGSTTEYYPSN